MVFLSTLAVALLFAPQKVHAIPPPDLLFQIGGQMGSILSVIGIIASAVLFSFVNTWKTMVVSTPKWLRVTLSVISCLIIIGIISWSISTIQNEKKMTTHEKMRAIIKKEHQQMPFTDGNPTVVPSKFFQDNSSLPILISNEEFTSILQSGQSAFFLDPRELEEFELGSFPSSNHIRYADLRVGDWKKLPTDRVVYIFCYGGARGEVIATFLRSRGILARALEHGASNWVKTGGVWEGTIDFYSHYNAKRYLLTLTKEQRDLYASQGATLIDTRMWKEFEASHIPGSIHIPVVYLPTTELDKKLQQVPRQSSVITLCDDISTCFDARIAGIQLEKRGHTLMGVYDASKFSEPVTFFGITLAK